MNGSKLIIITGPTAVGKTDIAIDVALMLDSEIINCDSMQIYKGMDIGSAKPTSFEMSKVKHHLINVADPCEEFSVAMYKDLATSAIAEVHSKGKIPILTGGSGLYIDAVLYDMDFGGSKASVAGFREELYRIAADEGNDALYARLVKVDSAAAERIHKNNIKRVIRAIEAAEIAGKPLDDFADLKARSERKYDAMMIGLWRDRAELYTRIEKRVDQLIEMGLEDEVRGLYEKGLRSDDIAMKGIGYKELISYIEGKIPFDEAVRLIKRNTRRYAKRQYTWFKRYEDMEWFDVGSYNNNEETAKDIASWLNKKY